MQLATAGSGDIPSPGMAFALGNRWDSIELWVTTLPYPTQMLVVGLTALLLAWVGALTLRLLLGFPAAVLDRWMGSDRPADERPPVGDAPAATTTSATPTTAPQTEPAQFASSAQTSARIDQKDPPQ